MLVLFLRWSPHLLSPVPLNDDVWPSDGWDEGLRASDGYGDLETAIPTATVRR